MQKDKRVLMVISQFYPLIGGAERQAQLLAEALIKKGWTVTIVTGWWIKKSPKKEIINGVPIHRNFTIGFNSKRKSIRFISIFIYSLTLFYYLIINRKKFDILHVHQAFYPAFISYITAKILKKPIVVKIAASGEINDLYLMERNRYPFGRLMSKAIKKSNYFVVLNKTSKKELLALGVNDSKISLIPNGVDVNKISPKYSYKIAENEKIKLIYLGRLSKEKGIDTLIKAINHPEMEKISLEIVGDGPLFPYLLEISKKTFFPQNITFFGETDNVFEKMNKSDIFVLPSKTEGMSNVLLEAMATALPCIVTAIPGNLEVVQEKNVPLKGKYYIAKNCLLVPPDDVEALRGAINLLSKDQDLREKLGKIARKLIEERFSIYQIAERYIKLYQKELKKMER